MHLSTIPIEITTVHVWVKRCVLWESDSIICSPLMRIKEAFLPIKPGYRERHTFLRASTAFHKKNPKGYCFFFQSPSYIFFYKSSYLAGVVHTTKYGRMSQLSNAYFVNHILPYDLFVSFCMGVQWYYKLWCVNVYYKRLVNNWIL